MEGNSIVLFENLCNIFEMRIKLDKENGVISSSDVLSNYEKYSKKIDAVYNSEFQKDLKPFMSPGITLQKEKDRLRRLIKLLEDRLERRNQLEDRYYSTTGKYITGLQMIVSEEELEEKKNRLSLVSKYLETSEEIENVTESINELKGLLLEEEEKKVQYESKNNIMEDELYSTFINVIKNIDYYKDINEDEISSELDNIKISVTEAKETLDITKDSIGSLITSGLEDDYVSYVEEAERNYYKFKNKEIVLNIYKIVSSFEDDFKLICAKRENINNLLIEKKELSDSISISTQNELIDFEKVVLKQVNTLNNEREILDNINNYISRINFKEERLEELNEVNNSVEVLSLLREYGIIETYDTEDVILEEETIAVDTPVEDIVVEETAQKESNESASVEFIPFEIPTLQEETNIQIPSLDNLVSDNDIVVEEVYSPYRIVDVIDYPKTLNVGLARLKGESVREKVNKKLNPPKQELEEDKEVVIEDSTSKEEISTVLDNVIPLDIPIIPDMIVKEETIPAQSIMEEVVVDKEKQDVKSEKVDTNLVWEIPTEVEPKSIVPEQKEVNTLPIWSGVEPLFESALPKEDNNKEVDESIDLNINSNVNDNMFWVPVSDAKIENNKFPSINTKSNFDNSSFVFPTINN